MSYPSRRARRAAYTLVESLVVLGIVAMLGAALLPIGTAVHASGRSADDLTNIGQLARSASIYAEDADNTFLCAGTPALDFSWSPARNSEHDAAGKPWLGWGLRLAPYTRSYDAFRSGLAPKTVSFSGECAHANGITTTNNYALNWMLGADGKFGDVSNPLNAYAWSPDGSRHFDHPVSTGEIAVPASTVSFLLSGASSPAGSELGCLGTTVKSSDFVLTMGRTTLQADGANLALTDGHARFLADPRVVADSAHNARRIYHLESRNLWMEPTMPRSDLGFQNVDLDEK